MQNAYTYTPVPATYYPRVDPGMNPHPLNVNIKATGEKNWCIIITGYIFGAICLVAQITFFALAMEALYKPDTQTNSHFIAICILISCFPGMFVSILNLIMACVDYNTFLITRKIAQFTLFLVGILSLAWMVLVIIVIISKDNGFGAISAYVAGFIGLGDGLIQGICCFLVANAFEVIQTAAPRRIVYLLPK